MPLWGSAQACSSCWVWRKERRIIPLQVSVSVAALHFQWLGKVTSRLESTTSRHAATKTRRAEKKPSFFYFYNLDPLDDPATTAEQSQGGATPRRLPPVPFDFWINAEKKSVATSTQIYISYLHSRLQNKGLIACKYVGLKNMALHIYSSEVCFPHSACRNPNSSQLFPTKRFWILCDGEGFLAWNPFNDFIFLHSVAGEGFWLSSCHASKNSLEHVCVRAHTCALSGSRCQGVKRSANPRSRPDLDGGHGVIKSYGWALLRCTPNNLWKKNK